jgi:hypothetical protein
MKVMAVAVALTVAFAAEAAAVAVPTAEIPKKPDPGVTPPAGQLQGGDTIETAVVIPELPYYTTGTTAGYNHDYDESCPYTGSTSPDVVYQLTMYYTAYVDIWTCESGYDTKIFVYENEYTPGFPLACNDDSPDCPGPVYRSWIPTIELTEGNTYYIVIDGYGGDFGDYLLTVEEVVLHDLCDVICPPGAFDEEEPDCYDGYEDETNGGCSVLAWSYPELNTFICGTTGNYNDNTWRDMDWYEVTLDEPKTVNWCICAGYPAALWIVDGREGCAGMYVMAYESGTPDVWSCETLDLEPGTYWFITSTDGWLGVPCGSEYVASLFEEGYSPVERASWGTIKTKYRM